MTSLVSPGFRSVGFRDIGSSAGALQPVPIAIYNFDEGRNLLKYSQDFDNAAWEKERMGVSGNVALAPNGAMTADFIIPSAVSGSHMLHEAYSVAAGTSYTISVYAQAGGYLNLLFESYGYPSDTTIRRYFNLSNGTVGNGSGTNTGAIENLGNGWYRCSMQYTPTASENVQFSFIVTNAANSGIVFTGDGTSGIYIWGAQLEVGSTPSEYFPTTDKQLLIDYSGNGNHGTLGSTAGVDTNDPTWTNLGLVYGADDSVKFGPIRNAAGVTQNLGAMLMAFYVPSAISAASTKTCSYSLGAGKAIYFGAVSGAPANSIVTVQYAAGSYSSWCSATDTIPIGWHTLAVNWNGLAYDIYIDGIPKPVITAGTPSLLSLTDANCCYDGTTFGINGLIRAERRIYPVGLSYSDLMQARRIIASDAWTKGIVLP